jgi:hypothetical protein
MPDAPPVTSTTRSAKKSARNAVELVVMKSSSSKKGVALRPRVAEENPQTQPFGNGSFKSHGLARLSI